MRDAFTISTQGELFSLMLRLHPVAPGKVLVGAGNQIQAAFLEMIRQVAPHLSDWLHAPNQRRPYTLGLLQGFNHLTKEQLTVAMHSQQGVDVLLGQVYWLRITMLDATIFGTFIQCLITQARTLNVRIGDAHFEISRLLTTPEPENTRSSWVGYSSFTEICTPSPAQTHYRFEFASPTAFSRGQRSWGKVLTLFPEPALVFESLARQWENFAPKEQRLAVQNLTPYDIARWCEEHILVSHYQLETHYLPSSKFGQTGFQGEITLEVKGNPTAPEGRWLTPLAKFAFFSGIGYKTAMGMGQARCTTLMMPTPQQKMECEMNA